MSKDVHCWFCFLERVCIYVYVIYIYVYVCRYTYMHTSVFYVNGKFETGLMKLKTKDMFLNLM